MSSYGRKLYELRKIKNISQNDVADALGVSATTISRYEREQIVPTEDVIVKTAMFFNVSADYILGLSSYKKGDKSMIKDFERIKEKAAKYEELKKYLMEKHFLGED
ncbi:MAG TPA: helix-turn-helix transcriptional regulator [Thermotogota bacterium]|nr:helix-turn-helix transcriptional regulator [Thermotogota bacterium]